MSRQHHKGKKRPRSWHMGRRQGTVNERMMKEVIEPEYAAAEADQARVKAATKEHRRRQGDYDDCLLQLDRANPYVPSWGFDL